MQLQSGHHFSLIDVVSYFQSVICQPGIIFGRTARATISPIHAICVRPFFINLSWAPILKPISDGHTKREGKREYIILMIWHLKIVWKTSFVCSTIIRERNYAAYTPINMNLNILLWGNYVETRVYVIFICIYMLYQKWMKHRQSWPSWMWPVYRGQSAHWWETRQEHLFRLVPVTFFTV